mmetsp:Transcript_5889/g.16057  ORF Transcript_5889/g.16057 Transcript_5889/m.16057 type:complete len:158 (+) Transcript_5889:66-539(+)
MRAPTLLVCALVAVALPAARTLPVAAGLSATEHPFEVCPDSVDHLHIRSLQFTPDPVSPEATLRVDIKGTLDEDVSGGKATLDISYYGVPLTSISFDLCTNFGITCPQKQGSDFEGHITYKVPAVPITGVTLDVQIHVEDEHGKPISCIKTQAKVVS